MNIDQVFQEKQQEIAEIAARNGVANVRPVGSGVSGEGEGGDVDFMVEMQPGYGFLHVAGLVMDLQEALGREVVVATERGLKCRIERGIHE